VEIGFKDWSYENSGMGYHKANTQSLEQIASQCGIILDSHELIQCPFPSHQGGNERTGSFKYYENTNTYNCYGCKNSGGPISFVSNLYDVSKEDAISMILSMDVAAVKIKEYDDCIDVLVEISEKFKEHIRAGRDIDILMSGFDSILANEDWERDKLEYATNLIKTRLLK